MKRFVIAILLLLSPYAYGLDKTVTSDIINQADRAAVRIEITKISIEDKAIWANLYDINDNLITTYRVYSYEGNYKDIPVVLLDSEKEYLDDKKPSETWEVSTIKLWLDGKQQKDELGKVLSKDPYKYDIGATKTELLNIVEQKDNLP